MSSKLIPSNPSKVMVIRNVTPNVVTLSVPFARFGAVKVGGRGTIVRLSSGNVAVFSPVALTPEVKAKVAELAPNGTVSYIFALDFEHHIFVSEWKKEYPEAMICGPEGLPEKRAKATDEKIGKEEFFKVFTPKDKSNITPEFDADFEFEYMDAHPGKEIVFFYKPDKVLIEADLLFNLPPTEQYSRVPDAEKDKQGIFARFFSSVQSTQGEAKGNKRFQWHVMSRANRPGFNASIKRIDAWDFVTLIPCHGDTIEGTGHEVFRKVFEWHLEGKK